MMLCVDNVPSERIRVFISSAQSDENGFAWADVRKSIKESLAGCVYLNPFIIEDEGSITPSLQFFQRQVEKADIVVLLIKGELRNGTSTEYTLATKLNKPLLAYFLKDDNPSEDVIKKKKKIESSDQCTYHKVDSFENIELIIRNDVMNNVVRSFQDKYSRDYYRPKTQQNQEGYVDTAEMQNRFFHLVHSLRRGHTQR